MHLDTAPARIRRLSARESQDVVVSCGQIRETRRSGERCFCFFPIGEDCMLAGVKKLLGWVFGPLFALLIVLAVRFFERTLRFEKRRDPAWRSQ
jgi:hypothetical protein